MKDTGGIIGAFLVGILVGALFMLLGLSDREVEIDSLNVQVDSLERVTDVLCNYAIVFTPNILWGEFGVLMPECKDNVRAVLSTGELPDIGELGAEAR